MTVNPFQDFGTNSPAFQRQQDIGTLQQTLDAFKRDYSVLAPLTIVKFGTLNITLDGTQLNDPDGQSFSIPHGLGYIPIFQVYSKIPGVQSNQDEIFPVPDSEAFIFTEVAPADTFVVDTQHMAYADTQNVYAVWHGHALTQFQQFFYVIYSNPIPVNT